ncbi:MAG: Hsp20/alpha crystallin family protein [Planctomycetales bacterium]|nr:Hsp20/alpha crystallin family protein [Planctomycetales bacterium]
MSQSTQKNRLTELLPGALTEVDSLFNQFFGHPAGARTGNGWYAPAALWEADDRLHLEIEAPGVARENVEVTFDKGVLSISLERARTDDRQYWHNERRYGKTVRSVSLPDTVDPNSIEAELNDGVLHISITKLPEAQPRKIELK